jgi:DUF1365 family protein
MPRLKPIGRRFSYRVMNLLIDLEAEHGRRRGLTAANLLQSFFRPLVTLKNVAAIHWKALQL